MTKDDALRLALEVVHQARLEIALLDEVSTQKRHDINEPLLMLQIVLRAAIREALEQQEPEIPDYFDQNWKGMDGAIAWHLIYRYAEGWSETGDMMNAWLDANRTAPPRRHISYVCPQCEASMVPDERPQQEPVAWVWPTDWEISPEDAFSWVQTAYHTLPLYTAPPRREWVGLTDEERIQVVGDICSYGTDFLAPLDAVVRSIDDLLKERNA